MSVQLLGEPLPGFTLPDIEGAETSLERAIAEKRGAVVVFWSGICSHCQRYDDALNSFSSRHPDLALIVVACRQEETVSDLRRTAKDRVLQFPLLYDADRSLARRWFVSQTPRVFLLDAKRRLLYRGAIDNFKLANDVDYIPYLEPAINSFLSNQPIERQETSSFGCPVESVYYDLPKPLGT